jgi:ribosomal protein S18 acetylase RimI-like enzyme
MSRERGGRQPSAGTDARGRQYVVRPTREDDAAAIVRLRDAVAAEGPYIAALPGERSVFEEGLAIAALVAEGGLSLTLEVDGDVAGHLMLRRRRGPHYGHTGEIAIIVHNRHRGAGFGRALMRDAIAWARDAGLAKLSLGVFPSNVPARALYRSLGFVEEGVARAEVRMPDGDHDLLLMGLLL